MNLFGKSPVQNPCEAETFEEAGHKNRVRLSHECDLCKDLREQMDGDKDPEAQAYDPDFWLGSISANEQAVMVYNDELKEFQKRVAEKLKELPVPDFSKTYVSGFRSIKDSWVKALEQNDPSVIVYW